MDSYVKLNIQSLKGEFPGLDGEIVEEVYFSSDKDCERARRALSEKAGQSVEGNEPTTLPGDFLLEEMQGDLFTCSSTASLCHCVSADMAMGKGIAVQFKKRFGQVSQLKEQKAGIGEAAVLHKPGQGNAFVYYLVTKSRYFHKPTLQSVRRSCEWMTLRNEVNCIAMPRIACGLDGLRWPDVKEVLADVFSNTNITIQVYTL